MFYKQCPKCGCIFSLRQRSCPSCGQRVFLFKMIKDFVEKGRLPLAIFTIFLLLVVGFGWFVRAETGSRTPLFVVFFLVAPLVPWILNQAYKHALKGEDEQGEDAQNKDDTAGK